MTVSHCGFSALCQHACDITMYAVAERHHGFGGLKPPQLKNTIEPNRGLARGNRENVLPIPGKLKKLIK